LEDGLINLYKSLAFFNNYPQKKYFVSPGGNRHNPHRFVEKRAGNNLVDVYIHIKPV